MTRLLLYQASFRTHRLRRHLICRLTDFGPPPPRALLILCNMRSGSTWLFDGLRCHPGIGLHRRYTLFDALGCVGRRYPLDLSGTAGPENTLDVEVEPRRFEQVPTFAFACDAVPQATLDAPWALEKFHPYFFGFRSARFLRRLERLEKSVEVQMLYLVREPEQALRSFARYRRRNPRWNAQIALERAPDHFRHTYETIARIASARPGIIVDYRELEDDLAGVLRRIFETLWPGVGRSTSAELLDEMRGRSARDGRPAGAAHFLGIDDGAGGTAGLGMLEGRGLEPCRKAYESVIALRTEARSAA